MRPPSTVTLASAAISAGIDWPSGRGLAGTDLLAPINSRAASLMRADHRPGSLREGERSPGRSQFRKKPSLASALVPDVILPVLDEAEALPWVLQRMPAGYRPI